jgi:hypothetical protein
MNLDAVPEYRALAAAEELFYRRGIQAVGMDAIHVPPSRSGSTSPARQLPGAYRTDRCGRKPQNSMQHLTGFEVEPAVEPVRTDYPPEPPAIS